MQTYNGDKWDDWMQATLAGDQKAYGLLLTDLRRWLTAYFAKRVHQHVIEDLVQDTLMSLHDKRQTYNPRYPFGPWITAIAKHRWIDHMRLALKYAEIGFDEDITVENQEQANSAKHDIELLLSRIPSNQANLIKMAKLLGMSIEEIAAKTGHSQASVKVMIHRGIKKMKNIVKESQIEKPSIDQPSIKELQDAHSA